MGEAVDKNLVILIERFVLGWDYLDAQSASIIYDAMGRKEIPQEILPLCNAKLAWFHFIRHNDADYRRHFDALPPSAGSSREVNLGATVKALQAFKCFRAGDLSRAMEIIKSIEREGLPIDYQARIDSLAGTILYSMGELELSEQTLDKSRFHLEGTDFKDLLANTLCKLGVVYKARAELHVAEKVYSALPGFVWVTTSHDLLPDAG